MSLLYLKTKFETTQVEILALIDSYLAANSSYYTNAGGAILRILSGAYILY